MLMIRRLHIHVDSSLIKLTLEEALQSKEHVGHNFRCIFYPNGD